MPQPPIDPPLQKAIRTQTTPNFADGQFWELVDRSSSAYTNAAPIPRGFPYSRWQGAKQDIIDSFSALYFLHEVTPLGGNDVRGMVGDKYVIFVWSTDETAENTYNADISYDGDSISSPIYIRRSKVRRKDYEANPTAALGSTLTALVGVKVTAAGTGYTDADAVVFSGGGGTGAAARIVTNSLGVILQVIVTNEGSGYTSTPTASITTTTGSGATLTGLIQSQSAVLIGQKKSELSDQDEQRNDYVLVERTYQILPGPYLPTTRYDLLLGPIQGTRRAVVNTSQTASLTATVKTTYESREGSSYVIWELVETNSNGTGSAGNPAYPINIKDFYDDERGAVHQTTQIVADIASAGSLAVAGGTATRISYEEYNQFLRKKITETWSVPGPTLRNQERYDEKLGKITGTRQLVENTSQTQSVAASGQTRYEPSSYGAILIWEVVESWSTTFPVRTRDFYDNDRGPVQQVSQLISATGSEAGTLTVAGGTTATKTDYEPYNEFLVDKIIETFAVPGPTLTATRPDVDGVTITETRILSEASTITAAETLVTGVWTRISKEPVNAVLAFKKTETRAIPGNPIYSTRIENDQIVAVVTTTLKEASVIVSDASESSGTITTVEKVAESDLVAKEVVTAKPFLDAATYTVSIPKIIPELFLASLETRTESHLVAGQAAEPELDSGEFERSERQLTDLLKEVRFTVLDDLDSLPITISGLKETNAQKQVVTVAMTLEADSATPTVPTALIDVDFRKLGNGLAIEITKTIASVFDEGRKTIEIPDVTPPWARALLATTTDSSVAAATSISTPTLSASELRKEVARDSEFTVRTTTESRDAASLPATRTNERLTREFGGGVVNEVQTIATGAQSASTGGLLVTDSEVEILGDGTSALKTGTLDGSEWPELVGTKVDENLRIAIPFTKQVVAAGATGSVVDNVLTEVEPLDKWRSITIASTIPDDLSSLDVTYPTTVNHIFPDTVTSASLVNTWAEVSNSDNEAFAYDLALKYVLVAGYRGPCDGQIIETYTSVPDATEYPVTKFFPQEYLATSEFWYFFGSDSAVHAQARIFQFRVPVSLHDEIDLTPATPSLGTAAGDVIPATNPVALPYGELITVDRQTERWRFGVWRNRVTQIYVPDPEAI